ncbi:MULTISPECIES: ShlB/FhaC/HecB family hemolysin secretion/activation protein [unclassified Nostoc]|uniref:ShlB/FhaC/HecB family hemolysin secretion/activation protein n=1 Tax=unclassified Nostoc TaxID=2593658 RepID=UPI002AD20D7C|nr:ShlB/FhaC/HecB family hemolysin secretion/activation protein [Nostoc sp. DedQUE03]MDZ7975741.1 ShlB/FhaC/HecB family hemolysin secretion/activation protein [Nostoc sp. DedQUE03]MDZ8048444.1 ShlB/FhaC/HecB family hemolysin secretion/activation protein [Nostoc sp. DedQUE02]
MVAKVTHTFAASCLLMLFNSLITTPSRAQTLNRVQPSQNNSPSLPQLPPPQDVQPPSPKTPTPPTPPQLPPPSELLQPEQPQPLPDEPLLERSQIFSVKQFEVIGNTVFSREKLTEVLAPFTNKLITFAQLLEARSKITELYIQEGYVTSGAYIPEQTFANNGVVQIQVIEGKLEDIQITGTKRLNPNYIRSRIALGASTPLNQKRLLESLQLLQLNPLIQNVSAELSAGSRTGANLLAIKITEADSFNIQAVLDNGRSPSIGSFRRQLQINEANLLGFGDSISLTYSNTDGSNTIDTSYSLPLNPRNGSLTFSYGTTSANVIERPFNTLDIESASQYYELTFRQPLVQTPNQEFALGITAFRRESDISSSLLEENEVPLSELSPGADKEGRTRVSALRFFQEWTSRNSQEVIAARSEFSLGIGAFNATINDTEPDGRFFAWRGQAQWVRLLAPDTLLLIRGNVQLACTELLASEQFGLGGINSVRGYRQDLLLTDNGVFASVEFRLPIARVPQWNGVLQVMTFGDVGTAWNNSSNRDENNTNTLASVGLGLRWLQGNNFTAGVEWGIPLVSVDTQTQSNTWQENGLYFFVQYNPF